VVSADRFFVAAICRAERGLKNSYNSKVRDASRQIPALTASHIGL
jgi:hypothetical protein